VTPFETKAADRIRTADASSARSYVGIARDTKFSGRSAKNQWQNFGRIVQITRDTLSASAAPSRASVS
jgi:hypothetical protein